MLSTCKKVYWNNGATIEIFFADSDIGFILQKNFSDPTYHSFRVKSERILSDRDKHDFSAQYSLRAHFRLFEGFLVSKSARSSRQNLKKFRDIFFLWYPECRLVSILILSDAWHGHRAPTGTNFAGKVSSSSFLLISAGTAETPIFDLESMVFDPQKNSKSWILIEFKT